MERTELKRPIMPVNTLLPVVSEAESTSNRTRRSARVAVPLLAAAAVALLTGCRQPQPKRCIDEKNQVVDPSFCEAQGQGQGQGQSQNNNLYHPGFWPYRYYYGGSGGFAPGSIVSGGSIVPTNGVSYSTTTRGGFGSSFGGGEAGGEGHGGSGGE